MLASSLHGLRFQEFLKETDFNVEFREDLLNWIYSGSERNEQSSVLKDTNKRYAAFCNEKLDGKRGKTAQYWMQYCQLVELYLLMNRAVKINYVDLYCYVLFELTALFFSTNHVNYAR